MQNIKKRLVEGVGINDANYPILTTTVVDGNRVRVRCPYYARWAGMLERGYSRNRKDIRSTYGPTRVCEQWHTFSNFRQWMEAQDWEGKHLDKDLLVPGNQVYSPDTCCFLSPAINLFLTDSAATRGEYPLGVFFDTARGKFAASMAVNGKSKNLGRFATPQEAHEAWRQAKIARADEYAAIESNPRIAEALKSRYREYIDPWFASQDWALAA